jgi:hypothetical protein
MRKGENGDCLHSLLSRKKFSYRSLVMQSNSFKKNLKTRKCTSHQAQRVSVAHTKTTRVPKEGLTDLRNKVAMETKERW